MVRMQLDQEDMSGILLSDSFRLRATSFGGMTSVGEAEILRAGTPHSPG